MTRLNIYRTDISPYQADDFSTREKLALESIDDVQYLENLDGEAPEVLITNTHTHFDDLPAKYFKDLKLLIHPNSGYDNIPASFVAEANFPIIAGNTIRAHAVAEYVIGRLFEHFSNVTHQEDWVPGREWNRDLIKEQEVLILGHGHIGSIVAASLKPLVKKVHVYDPHKGLDLDLDLLKVAKTSRVVIPLTSLNETSEKIVSAEMLDALPTNFVLINGARGGLVDESALIKSLTVNSSAFAYLDVFESEPFISSDFKDIKNMKRTSHLAGVHNKLDEEIINFSTSIIKDFKNLDEKSFLKTYSSLVLKNRLKDRYLI